MKNNMDNAWTQKIGVNHSDSDEWYTPPEAVKILLKYIRPCSKILCPFDTEESNYVKILKQNGHNVIYSHISEGKDFFELEKPDVDYIISNPPFSKRDQVLHRLYEWGIPFAMLFNCNGLFDSKKRFYLAKRFGVNVIYISPRVRYIDSIGNRNSPPFQSAYWSYGMVGFLNNIYFERMETEE